MISCAESTPSPGTSASRSAASWCWLSSWPSRGRASRISGYYESLFRLEHQLLAYLDVGLAWSAAFSCFCLLILSKLACIAASRFFSFRRALYNLLNALHPSR